MMSSVPDHINPIQWQQALAVSRQTCAQVFREGGTAAEALAVLDLEHDEAVTWEKAVDRIAARICSHQIARAA
jgi:hypothetical protein